MREYSVAIRIFSKTMTPGSVSEQVGLKPTFERSAKPGDKSAREHVWEFEPDYKTAADNFPGRVAELLDSLAGVEDQLLSLGYEADLVLWAACFTDEVENTIEIPAELMQRFAVLGISVSVSVCYSD